ncbi:hypothetical protein [Flavobacterium sp. UGB4466]|uniref:hypothetical protein n=1 Tax=Flavobacterium sp. UGB4466 TaxID=2730889 RepID=UPI00192B952B|nr:hypothetical protein [Flavobacterium sp. UGB4466]
MSWLKIAAECVVPLELVLNIPYFNGLKSVVEKDIIIKRTISSTHIVATDFNPS